MKLQYQVNRIALRPVSIQTSIYISKITILQLDNKFTIEAWSHDYSARPQSEWLQPIGGAARQHHEDAVERLGDTIAAACKFSLGGFKFPVPVPGEITGAI